jgi:hypothetical protein
MKVKPNKSCTPKIKADARAIAPTASIAAGLLSQSLRFVIAPLPLLVVIVGST